ncbi:MAG: hypothetical protein KY445_11855 [Armatimonadetes bacterium]|nr:hypothetical protein [Armatimonadota bacterium]
MNHEEDWPASARRAFDSYPKIAASPDFNARVLAALEERGAARQTTILGRLEDFLGLPLGQFLGSGALGALFSGVLFGIFLLLAQPTSVSPVSTPKNDLPHSVMGPIYARRLLENQLALREIPTRKVEPPQHRGKEEISCGASKSRWA